VSKKCNKLNFLKAINMMSGDDRDHIYKKNKNKRTKLRFYLDNVVVNAAILPAFKFMGLDPLLKC
jgi:hypothetical protein